MAIDERGECILRLVAEEFLHRAPCDDQREREPERDPFEALAGWLAVTVRRNPTVGAVRS